MTKVCPSLSIYGFVDVEIAMHMADEFSFDLSHAQICPQNNVLMTPDYSAFIKSLFPKTQFRLHANVRVDRGFNVIYDFSNFDQTIRYWKFAAICSSSLGAKAYSAHAGSRKNASIDQILEAQLKAIDLFGVPVAIEGLYPNKSSEHLVSTWDEYREIFNRSPYYAIDLSHLNIVAKREGYYDREFLKDLLASDACIEVHVSGNNGDKDSHHAITGDEWWMSDLAHINPNAIIFNEGRLR